MTDAVHLPPVVPNDFIHPSSDANGWWAAFFSGSYTWRWTSPRLYYRPGLDYGVGGTFQIVDSMGRTKNYDRAFDSLFNAQDGRLETLYVQTTDSLCKTARVWPNCTWKRTVMRNVAPLHLRLANLPYRFISPEKRDDLKRYEPGDWALVAALWLPATALIMPAVWFLGDGYPDGKDVRYYLPLPGCDLRYPRLARNLGENREAVRNERLRENDPSWSLSETPTSNALGPYRTLRPRFLYYLEVKERNVNGVVQRIWSGELHGVVEDDFTPYVFVAFTSEQFPLPRSEAEVHDLNGPRGDPQNINLLRAMGTLAAVEHFGLPNPPPDYRDKSEDPPRVAFWIGTECIPIDKYVDANGITRTLGDSPKEEDAKKHLASTDTYGISDIVRNAEHTIVLSGHPQAQVPADPTDEILKAWGRRVWTLPEVVLSKGPNITILHCWKLSHQSPTGPSAAFETVSKIVFARRAWTDAARSRQLIEHFGNLHLSRLELTKVALECLLNRELKIAFAGDRSYAMMGLLRVRPPIDKSDSGFQAFARLSLPQDNDRLMERLICLLPQSPTESWEKMSDQYAASLWDIYPETQVCAVGEGDTVVIDGAVGAQIQWDGFSPIRNCREFSWGRYILELLITRTPLLFFLFIYLSLLDLTRIWALPLLIIWLIFIVLPQPWYVYKLFQGKLSAVEPAFFGIEGYVPIDRIEEKLFGARMGRMSWSPYGSPLARHRQGEELPERTAKYSMRPRGYGVGAEEAGEEMDPLVTPETVGTYPIKAIDPTTACGLCEGQDIRGRICTEHETEWSCFQKSRSSFGKLKVFTLVDTFNMTATLFHAVRPPTAVIIGGSEGGMKRAIACSFDMMTGTMHRETVLRIPSLCADRMEALPRIRLGLHRPVFPGDVMLSSKPMKLPSGTGGPMAQQPTAAPVAVPQTGVPVTMTQTEYPKPEVNNFGSMNSYAPTAAQAYTSAEGVQHQQQPSQQQPQQQQAQWNAPQAAPAQQRVVSPVSHMGNTGYQQGYATPPQ